MKQFYSFNVKEFLFRDHFYLEETVTIATFNKAARLLYNIFFKYIQNLKDFYNFHFGFKSFVF